MRRLAVVIALVLLAWPAASRASAEAPDPALVALGQQLFFDSRVSRTGRVSCASCHQPDHGFSDPRRFSPDADGRPSPRHTPTIVGRRFGHWQGWSGRNGSIEEQVLTEPNFGDAARLARLGNLPGYRRQFEALLGGPPTPGRVAVAIAAYVRAVVSTDAPYDRFVAGDAGALTPAARRGLSLFTGRALCVVCHKGDQFTDEGFHNLGVGTDGPSPDPGRAEVYGNPEDWGAFKTPTLRDVARRGPYMHDGSLPTLEAVVAFYDRGGIANRRLSTQLRPLHLTPEEQRDLVAFLEALTGRIDPALGRMPELPD
ncbi:MAG TPA: cytochrome c peroxidase [Thermodesulfobacteriota bacterium]